jgi:hypothetical protein
MVHSASHSLHLPSLHSHQPRSATMDLSSEQVFSPRNSRNDVSTVCNAQPDSITPSESITDPSSPGVTRSDASAPSEKSQRLSTAAITDEPRPSKRAPQPTCFRISGIPSNWDCHKLEEHLRTIDPELDLEAAELSGPFPDCYDSRQTALLNLNDCTTYFRFTPNEERQKVITDTDRRKVRLLFDKHFYDLTPLNRAEEPIEMELVNPQKYLFPMLLTHSYTVWSQLLGLGAMLSVHGGVGCPLIGRLIAQCGSATFCPRHSPTLAL